MFVRDSGCFFTITELSHYYHRIWNKLKQRLKEEGNETVTNCHQLKLLAEDDKMRLTDVAKVARTQLESKLRRSVVTQANARKSLSEKTKDRGKDE